PSAPSPSSGSAEHRVRSGKAPAGRGGDLCNGGPLPESPDMAADDTSGIPDLEAGPALAWAAVFIAGVVGLVILAASWTSGGFPSHFGRGLFRGWASQFPLYLSIALPAALVLGVGAYVARIRWGPVRSSESLEENASSSPTASAGH
ncbi:MAG: hypothetical protein ACREC5_07155, partial [Thermoplasmata archaeon]